MTQPKYFLTSDLHTKFCFSSGFECVASTHPSLSAQSYGQIMIQVSDNSLNQIESRIFQIYLHEELGYPNVFLEPTVYTERKSERSKLLNLLLDVSGPTLNLGVWMPADFHTMPPFVEMAGRLSTGFFGWFVPKLLIRPNDLPSLNFYTIFKHPDTSTFKQFVFDDSILNVYEDGHSDEDEANNNYVPEQCKGKDERCVTLLAGWRRQTEFVIKHINELKLYVKVKWLGANLQAATRHLFDQFSRNRSEHAGQKFAVLHYSPSEVIDTDIEFETITMPACKDLISSNETLCQYETTAILKYFSSTLSGKNGINNALREITFNRTQEIGLLRRYQSYVRGTANNLPASDPDTAFDYVACEWLRENRGIWSKWIPQLTQEIIYIGGIFPNTHESNREHEGECPI